MGVEQVAAVHQRRQIAIARRAAERVAQLWRQIDRSNIAASWRQLLAQALPVVSSAQGIAAASAGSYVDDALEAQGVTAAAEGRVSVTALAGVASDGRDLAELLYQPAVRTLVAIGAGHKPSRAMTAGAVDLDMIVRTQIADAGRVASSVAITARPEVPGYVRMLSLPSCSRCVILAGKFYRWNAGFKRHPRCDCRHIPASEGAAGDLTTDPMAAFRAMDHDEQDRIFTKAGAQAIRDGADMAQVVNARRGARGLTPAGARLTAEEARTLRGGRNVGHLERVDVFGRQLYITTEGVTVRGVAGVRLGARETGTTVAGQRYRSARAPRLMPESIYEIAGGNRDEAIRLLKRFGYLF